MKLSDIILIISLSVLSLLSVFSVSALQRSSSDANGTALVTYQNELILEIALGSEAYTIHNPAHVLELNIEDGHFVVSGSLGPVTLLKENGTIRVTNQTSPENICELQGATNSPLKPLTCLPNELVIRIERSTPETDEDAILS